MRRRLRLGLVVATGFLLMIGSALLDGLAPGARPIALLVGVVGFALFGLSGLLYTALFVREFFTTDG